MCFLISLDAANCCVLHVQCSLYGCLNLVFPKHQSYYEVFYQNPVLTFGSYVSNIDFVKVLEIEFIFFYLIFWYGQSSGH